MLLLQNDNGVLGFIPSLLFNFHSSITIFGYINKIINFSLSVTLEYKT